MLRGNGYKTQRPQGVQEGKGPRAKIRMAAVNMVCMRSRSIQGAADGLMQCPGWVSWVERFREAFWDLPRSGRRLRVAPKEILCIGRPAAGLPQEAPAGHTQQAEGDIPHSIGQEDHGTPRHVCQGTAACAREQGRQGGDPQVAAQRKEEDSAPEGRVLTPSYWTSRFSSATL